MFKSILLLSSSLLFFSLICCILDLNKYRILKRQAPRFPPRDWRELGRITIIWAVIIGFTISITVSSSTSNTKLLSILSPLLNKIIILIQIPLSLVLKGGIWDKIIFNIIFVWFTILYIILSVLGTSCWSLPGEFLFLAVVKLWLLLTSYNKRYCRKIGSHNTFLPGLILDITKNILACGGSIASAIIGYFDQQNDPGSSTSIQAYILLAGLLFVCGILGELWWLWKVGDQDSVVMENQGANDIMQGQLESVNNN
ncbi:55aec746-bc3a-4050-b575-829e503db1a9-CDS [Sclerotinia trifoliorum]|uniref:55aec746-bc3a-4050-b575-829e503db1a9-CDS n=1 Tax=Sclerotinia trifoliorum TaxID=28548 RepID=A0A8H2VY46_9HELO|nr:55aec746-bc3a-4050-b575-829e503db1a9-CDS [Sclerotinia trifoliorum]